MGADKQECHVLFKICSKCMGIGLPHAEDDCVTGEDEL